MSLFGIFIVALIMSFAFSPYRRENPLGPMILFFLLLLLAGLAAHFWVLPFGPRVWGVSWLPVLVMMFAFGLLFSSPPPRHMRKKEVKQELEATGVMGIFLWLLFFILLAAVIIGLYHSTNTPA